jgi:hypothetical protein
MLGIPHLKATGGRDRFAFPPLPGAAGSPPGKRQGAVTLNRRNGDRRLINGSLLPGTAPDRIIGQKTLLLLLLEPSPQGEAQYS